MEFVPLYRQLLKRVYAARGRPHHLQDIRFILSYPRVEASPLVESINEQAGEPTKKQKQQQQQRMQPVDPDHILRICCEDLRRALMGTRSDGDSQAASPNLTPVAQRFIHMRELAWLKTRLEDVMSNATDAILKEARMVASDLSECDFLDDALFSRTATQHDEDAADGKIRHDACEENKCVGGVASAGELGPRREMFILRHVAPFPLAKEYLGAFGMDRNAVSAAAVSHEQLVDFARCHVPRRITCQNSDLTITVTVRPFDPAVTGGRLAESGGPFAQAHRCFMLRFDLQPHDPAARIDVVNSYFLRLDLASSELLEDVGYVHAAHVWRLSQPPFRRRDSNKGSSSSGDNDNDNDNGNGYTESLPRFELSFVNPSDSPMVMKGELYYILRTDNDKTPACELPIRVVSFGHLLLFNGE